MVAMLQAMHFLANSADMPELQRTLQEKVVQAFQASGKCKERKEQPPLPWHWLVDFEQMVLNTTTPLQDRLMGGFWLLCVWTSLRFADGLGVDPADIELKSGVARGFCWQSKSKKLGHAWAMLEHGCCSNPPESGWVSGWLSAIAHWQSMNSNRVDFCLPYFVHMDKGLSLLPQPMSYMRALAYLRNWASKAGPAGMSDGLPVPLKVATHSCKATMLAWSHQAGVPLQNRAAQGHHQLKTSPSKMVSLYGRDDTREGLQAQKADVQAAKAAYRFHVPVMRGALHPIEPLLREIAPPAKKRRSMCTRILRDRGCQRGRSQTALGPQEAQALRVVRKQTPVTMVPFRKLSRQVMKGM